MRHKRSSSFFSSGRWLLGLAVGLGLACPTSAQLQITRHFSVCQSIPDGWGELLDAQTINCGTANIAQVQVFLELDGRSSGMFNGDIYASLGHSSGFAVLLNRVGKKTAGGLGYSDNGFCVTFDDAAPNGDVHAYRRQISGSDLLRLSGPLSGLWQPDGRTNDPLDVVTTNGRVALLASFAGLPASGEWDLLVSDQSVGGTAQLKSWGLSLWTTALPTGTLAFTNGDQVCVDVPQMITNITTLGGQVTFCSTQQLVLAGPITGSGQLVQSGSAPLVLGTGNDYSGGTVIDGGTLVVTNATGSATGSGQVVVTNGGVLEGNGHITGALLVNNGGTVAPGDSPGNLSVGPTIWGADGNYFWQINQADGIAGADPGWSLLTVNGDLDIQATAAHPFTVELVTLTGGAPGPAANFHYSACDQPSGYSWVIATVSGNILNFDSAKFVVNTNQWSNFFGAGSFSVSLNGHTVRLDYSPNAPCPNHAPIANPNTLTTTQDHPAQVSAARLLANDTDADNDTLTVTGVSPTSTSGGTVSFSAGRVTYTPPPSYTGADSFTYFITDGRGASATGTVTVTVTTGAARVQSIAYSPAGVTVYFAGVPGWSYTIQRATSISGPWSNLQTTNAPPAGVFTYRDATPPSPSGYYRLLRN